MRISPDRLAKIAAEAPTFGFKIKSISLDSRVQRLSREIRKQIKEHHQPTLLLFDEALRFMIGFENYQYERKNRPPEATPFILVLSRVRSDLLSIRQLLLLGQESAALAVARVFLEDIEIAMATVVSPLFAQNYMDAESTDAFWSKHIAYGKIYPLVEEFLRLGNQGTKVSSQHIKNHRDLKNFLSDHIHPTISSAFRTAMPPALEMPGHFANRPVGWFGENSGRLCLFLAEEVQVFSACCITAFIRPNPPAVLANYIPDRWLATFMLPAHNLQTLLAKYAARLHADYDRRAEEWEKHEDFLSSET